MNNEQLESWFTKPATRVGVVGYHATADAWCVAGARGWKWGLQDGGDITHLATAAPRLAEALAGLREPSAVELATRGAKALATWAAAGFPVVSAAELAIRRAACASCDLWDAAARAGLGRCQHRQCGCTRLKWWLQTETCPAGKWPGGAITEP